MDKKHCNMNTRRKKNTDPSPAHPRTGRDSGRDHPEVVFTVVVSVALIVLSIGVTTDTDSIWRRVWISLAESTHALAVPPGVWLRAAGALEISFGVAHDNLRAACGLLSMMSVEDGDIFTVPRDSDLLAVVLVTMLHGFHRGGALGRLAVGWLEASRVVWIGASRLRASERWVRCASADKLKRKRTARQTSSGS